MPGVAPAGLDAGHFSSDTAYAAVNGMRRDDMRPHIWRTHDGGRRWTRIVGGLPDSGPVNVVREDPKQPGLLFAWPGPAPASAQRRSHGQAANANDCKKPASMPHKAKDT